MRNRFGAESPRSRSRGRRRVLALCAPTLLPGLLVHPELDLVDVGAVPIVDLVTMRELSMSELRHDLERGGVVGAELERGQAQVEVVEDIPVQGQRGVKAVALAPFVRIDDQLVDVEAVPHRPEMADREADEAAARVD